MTYAWLSVLSFGFSFLFALGGVGAAIALVPVMHALGIPLNEARPTGLFVNTVSLSGASWDNIRNHRLDFRLGLPIIITSAITAPIGAWSGRYLPERAVLLVFTMYENRFRTDRPIVTPGLIGIAAGFISGLLGVGGGGLISPLMILLGFNPKKVAAVTAFVVPFSSLTGFVTYAAMGHFRAAIVLPVGLAAYAGGLLGTRLMQRKIPPKAVRRILGGILILLALKLLMR